MTRSYRETHSESSRLNGLKRALISTVEGPVEFSVRSETTAWHGRLIGGPAGMADARLVVVVHSNKHPWDLHAMFGEKMEAAIGRITPAFWSWRVLYRVGDREAQLADRFGDASGLLNWPSYRNKDRNRGNRGNHGMPINLTELAVKNLREAFPDVASTHIRRIENVLRAEAGRTALRLDLARLLHDELGLVWDGIDAVVKRWRAAGRRFHDLPSRPTSDATSDTVASPENELAEIWRALRQLWNIWNRPFYTASDGGHSGLEAAWVENKDSYATPDLAKRLSPASAITLACNLVQELAELDETQWQCYQKKLATCFLEREREELVEDELEAIWQALRFLHALKPPVTDETIVADEPNWWSQP